jgi:hypothetical protein
MNSVLNKLRASYCAALARFAGLLSEVCHKSPKEFFQFEGREKGIA